MSAPASYLEWIRHIADFPKPGIRFADIMPLLARPQAFAELVTDLATPWRELRIDVVAGIESRGFILGAPLARELGCGFVPLRKPGKLPGRTHGVDYALEYGSDRLEMQSDVIAAGQRVLLVDDVLATGGTLCAAASLLQHAGVELVGASVMLEILPLAGRQRWDARLPLHALSGID